MGKTILELFNSSKEVKQIPQPKATSGIADRGQFLIDRENNLGQMAEKIFDPKTETALEQELSGLRPMRLVNSPTLYGTDILRLSLQKTPDVDAMKLSKNPDAQISLGKIGKFVQKVGDKVSKTLGIPQNVFPTYVINTKEFKEGATPNKMIVLGEIKKDARGTALGRFLKSTGAGTPSQLAKQSFGNAINLAKNAVRYALVGDRFIPVTSGSLDNFVQKFYFPKADELTGTYSNSMIDFTNPGSKQQANILLVSPAGGKGLDRTNIDGGYPGLFGTPRKFANRNAIYGFQLSSGTTNQKFGEPSQIDLNSKYNNPDKPYLPTGSNQSSFEGKLKNNAILEFVKPKSLREKTINRYSSDKNKKSYHNNSETIYNNKLDGKRGLFSTKDVLNQTGRLSKSELSSIKYNGKTLDEVDLIPLRFQRVNDGGAVYFRSLVSGLNETFSPTWEGSKMLGSPFNFYSYTGIERKLTFNLKVYAMSQAELVMMWRRLEFLAHCAYPYQYNAGIIEPTLLYFTFGNLYVNKACFLDSLSYSIEDSENLWELGGGILKTKPGAMESSFNNNFYAGTQNGEENSKENGKGATKTESKLNVSSKGGATFQSKYDMINSGSNNTLLYDTATKQSKIITQNHTTETAQGNYDMDSYKLPKFINASVGLTFIETKSTTDFNVYGYGKKIGTGK